MLSAGSINLSSVDTRHKRARQYADLARAPQIDFLRLIESFAYRVHDAVRIGEPAVDLRDVPPATAVDTLDLHGIQILDKHPIIPFGNGGVAKSLLALWLGGELVRRGLVVLYADWELSAEDHSDRLGRLFGPDMPSMLYARCTRPLTAEADRLRRLVRQHRADYPVGARLYYNARVARQKLGRQSELPAARSHDDPLTSKKRTGPGRALSPNASRTVVRSETAFTVECSCRHLRQ